ncbi:unnamed protein product [Coffea canephora]|uniref:Uncharacterized protein n=1 Tax=Coffea canephora TaxID=49390 RepID=A0A068VEG6_COFCA|nr:unnamed protein product [Coffea canephora]
MYSWYCLKDAVLQSVHRSMYLCMNICMFVCMYEVEEKMRGQSPRMFEDFVRPFQINLAEDGPWPHNDHVRYQPLDIYPAPLHRC